MPPPCWASSTMVSSSLSVTEWSELERNSLRSPRFSRVKRKFTGLSTTISTRMIGVENMAKPSAFSFARLLGQTSPKISTATVITMVETVGPAPSPKARVKSTVAMAVEAIFTRLFPTRMVDKSSS